MDSWTDARKLQLTRVLVDLGDATLADGASHEDLQDEPLSDRKGARPVQGALAQPQTHPQTQQHTLPAIPCEPRVPSVRASGPFRASPRALPSCDLQGPSVQAPGPIRASPRHSANLAPVPVPTLDVVVQLRPHHSCRQRTSVRAVQSSPRWCIVEVTSAHGLGFRSSRHTCNRPTVHARPQQGQTGKHATGTRCVSGPRRGRAASGDRDGDAYRRARVERACARGVGGQGAQTKKPVKSVREGGPGRRAARSVTSAPVP